MTTLSEGMRGVETAPGTKAKIIQRNTFRYVRPDGSEAFRLHRTDVVVKLPSGKVKLDSGGWKTVTTKDRLSAWSGYVVGSRRGAWYVCRPGEWNKTVPFFDGMVLPDALDKPGEAAKAKRAAAKDVKLEKVIKAFVCEGIPDRQALPIPNGGDCWLCMAETEALRPGRDGLGRDVVKLSDNSEHIRSHIAERYMHGTLILNALVAAGYRDPAFAFRVFGAARLRQIVGRYLRRRVGLAV